MGFPVVIGGDTIAESSFTGLSYITGLQTLVEKLGTYVARLPYATSTSSVTIGTGTKTLTVQTGRLFYTLQSVRVYKDASNYFEGTVVSYNESTGALEVYSILSVGSGTYTAWNVFSVSTNTDNAIPSLSAGAVTAPLPIYAGGSPAVSNISKLPEILRSEGRASLCSIGSNFFHKYDSSRPYPFYVLTESGGSVDSEGNYYYAVSGIYPGIWALRATNPGDKAFISYGELGFIQLDSGGDLEACFRVGVQYPASTSDYGNIRLGFMSQTANELGDQFSSFGFGVEILGGDLYPKISFVVHDSDTVVRVPIGVVTVDFHWEFFIRFCAASRSLIFGLNVGYVRDYLADSNFSKLITEISLEKFFRRAERESSVMKKASLLKPFFYFEKAEGTTPAALYVDTLHVTRVIRRK